MHCRDLVVLAGLLAARSRLLTSDGFELSRASVEDYWTASKCRLDRWGRELKVHSMRICAAPSGATGPLWRLVRPMLEEILTGELLTRVFAATCCLCDEATGSDTASPLARNIVAGHLDARRRALNLMLFGHGFEVDEAFALNRVRRRTESWTDVLLAMLGDDRRVREFAFCGERLRDFANQSRGDRAAAAREPLVVASLRVSYQKDLMPISPNADLNDRIAAAVLGCFAAPKFDSLGLLKPFWLERLMRSASDAQGMVDELLAPEGPGDDALWQRRRDLRHDDRLF